MGKMRRIKDNLYYFYNINNNAEAGCGRSVKTFLLWQASSPGGAAERFLLYLLS